MPISLRLRGPATLALGLLLAVVPVAAAASIPPSLALLVVSDDPHAEALSLAYVEYLIANENFLDADSTLPRWQIADCLKRAGDLVSCVAAQIAAKPIDKRAPPVVVVVQPIDGDVYRWRCVGADPTRQGKTAKSVSIDLQKALFGTREARIAQRTAAMGCLFGAGAEADGVIRQ